MTQSTPKIKPLQVEQQKIIPYPPAFYQQIEEDTIDVLELLKIIWHGKWLIIAFIVIGTLSSYAFTTILPKTYTATVQFLTDNENVIKSSALNPKLLHEIVMKEDLKEAIFAGMEIDNLKSSLLSLEEQAVGKLLEEEVLSFNKSTKFNNTNMGFLTVSLFDPESAAIIANKLPELLNFYSSKDEIKRQMERKFVLNQQIKLLRNSQEQALDKIKKFSQFVAINFLEKDNEKTNFLTVIKERLGEKLSEMAIASSNQGQKTKYNKLQLEVESLENLLKNKYIELQETKNSAFKLESAKKNYQTLVDEEIKIIKEEQVINKTISNLRNRKIEIIATASTPQFPSEPNTKFIVASSAVFSLFLAIFLVFTSEFVRNYRNRIREN